MSTLVTILHVIVCLFLMLTVLLQEGKGGGMGGAFGGANAGSVFGGAGASTFLRRLTAIAATVFMLTSMVLAFLASRDAGDSLEKYSNSEAARRKRVQEAEKRAFESSLDGGLAPDGDAGVTIVPGPTGATIDPTAGSGAAGATGPEIPVEIPAAGSADPAAGSAAPAAGSAAPSSAPPATTPSAPPAAAPPAAPPAGSAAPAPAASSPGAGTATGSAQR